MAMESNNGTQDALHRWVETWQNAGPELMAIRHREAANVPVSEAIRQLFDGMDSLIVAPGQASSGLVEQQMWFSRIRTGLRREPTAPPSGK